MAVIGFIFLILLGAYLALTGLFAFFVGGALVGYRKVVLTLLWVFVGCIMIAIAVLNALFSVAIQ